MYFLDLGMVGEVEPRLRELILLLLLAFLREDAHFLVEVMLMLSDEQAPDVDMDALEADFADFIARFRSESGLGDIDIGGMLEEMADIGARHRIQLPAALALSGKAFGQMQLAVAALDPGLDAFSVIGKFLLRGVGERLRDISDPQKLFYEAQKLKVRVNRLIESVERMTGARPGDGCRWSSSARSRSRRRSCALGAALSWPVPLLRALSPGSHQPPLDQEGDEAHEGAQQDALVACLSRPTRFRSAHPRILSGSPRSAPRSVPFPAGLPPPGRM